MKWIDLDEQLRSYLGASRSANLDWGSALRCSQSSMPRISPSSPTIKLRIKKSGSARITSALLRLVIDNARYARTRHVFGHNLYRNFCWLVFYIVHLLLAREPIYSDRNWGLEYKRISYSTLLQETNYSLSFSAFGTFSHKRKVIDRFCSYSANLPA